MLFVKNEKFCENTYVCFFAANDMYLFMLKWYEKFPSYRTRELFLTGESYAGSKTN